MNKVLLFIIIMLITTPTLIFIFRLLFKKSLTFKISIFVLIITETTAFLSFYVGYSEDFSNTIWTTPIGLVALAFAFIAITKNLKKLEILKNHLEAIGKNNLTTIVDQKLSNREDEIGEIAKSIIRIQQQQTQIISSISNSAASVLSAGNQLNSVSQDVSQRANEQASTTEEIAASMVQMLATINSNTKKAEQTEKTSEKSANEIKQSNETFVKTIKSVSEISEKISIITEIADKTDILSINAAIEAARAGEAGKGFAVVAQEIRKLADKTKIASDKITELSQNGQDISRIAGEALEKVIPEIINSAELVGKIVLASREHQSGVENINTSIQQLTEITNENSASAEEMASSAEELSTQAKQLKKLISVFKIGDLQNENVVIKQEN